MCGRKRRAKRSTTRVGYRSGADVLTELTMGGHLPCRGWSPRAPFGVPPPRGRACSEAATFCCRRRLPQWGARWKYPMDVLGQMWRSNASHQRWQGEAPHDTPNHRPSTSGRPGTTECRRYEAYGHRLPAQLAPPGHSDNPACVACPQEEVEDRGRRRAAFAGRWPRHGSAEAAVAAAQNAGSHRGTYRVPARQRGRHR